MMKKIMLAFFVAAALVFGGVGPNVAEASSYHYCETFIMNNPYQYSEVEGISSDGSNFIFLTSYLPIDGDLPIGRVDIVDLYGNLVDSFDGLGAFIVGITYTGSKIIFSGGSGLIYDGQLYEINPIDGVFSTSSYFRWLKYIG